MAGRFSLQEMAVSQEYRLQPRLYCLSSKHHDYMERAGHIMREHSMVSVNTVPAGVVRAAVLEVRVHACLLGRDTPGWIVLQQGIKQIQSVLFETGDQSPCRFTLPLGEGRLEIGERSDTGPNGFVGGTKEPGRCVVSRFCNDQALAACVPEDLKDLIDLGVTGEQGFTSAHLSKDSAHRPHVYTSRVLASTK